MHIKWSPPVCHFLKNFRFQMTLGLGSTYIALKRSDLKKNATHETI